MERDLMTRAIFKGETIVHKATNKPQILALNQTLTWQGKLAKRKMFSKYEVIELVKQLQTDQFNADIAWFKKWLIAQAVQDSRIKFRQTKAYELWWRLERLIGKSNE